VTQCRSQERRFRNKWLTINVDNSRNVEKGIVQLTVNGESIDGNYIPFEMLGNQNEIMVKMG